MSLIELAERVEAASGPSHEVDLAIATASYELRFPIYGEPVNYDPALWLERNGPISASLDAAMTLVPEGCLWHVTNTSVEEHFADLSRATALVGYPDETRDNTVEAATPALALCAAALRARAQQEQAI